MRICFHIGFQALSLNLKEKIKGYGLEHWTSLC